MPKFSREAGSTSQSINVFIQNSSSTTGAGLTGLVYNTSGLIAYYTFTGANCGAVAITLATLAAVNSAYSSGGFKEIHSTNTPGLYRFDLPDAVIAAGKGNMVTVFLQGAANMAPCPSEVELTGWDNQDAVRGGMTAMPNANAGATNGLPLAVDNSGRVDVLKINGTSQTARDIGASVLLSTGTGTGQLDFTSGIVKSNLAQILGTALTETAGLLAGGFKKFFNVASPTLTCLGIDQSGDTYARTGAPVGASISADIAAAKVDTSAIKTKTDSLTFTNAGKVDANTLQVGGTVQTARDLGASVLLSSGTGTGQVSLSSGKVSLVAADITAIEAGTWDVAIAGHVGAGSTGAALNGAGSAGDPWTTPLPGAYGAGTAGNIVGVKLDAAVSSRSTYAGGDTTGTTTLLARLTSTRAALLDNLDAAVSGVAAAVWAAGGRTLTGFGTLVADVATAVWGAVTRSLTDKAGFTLSAAYDAAKTAGDATAASQTSILAKLPAALNGGRMDASVGAYQAGQVPAKVADLPAVPTTDAIVLAILQRKITLDAITGEFVIWDAAGTSEVARLTPTTDAAALPIVGMRPSV